MKLNIFYTNLFIGAHYLFEYINSNNNNNSYYMIIYQIQTIYVIMTRLFVSNLIKLSIKMIIQKKKNAYYNEKNNV